MNDIINWLLEGDPWVRYRTKRDLTDLSEDDPSLMLDFNEMASHPLIISMIKELQNWPEPVLKRHNDAKHPLHKLVFLSELGFGKNHPGMALILEKVMGLQSEEGVFKVLVNLPAAFGGSGKDECSWMLCDAPLLLYALSESSFSSHPELIRGLRYLVGLLRDNGWPCAASESFGKKFKGPGRREDPCPYANLVMLRMLSAFPEFIDSNEADKGIETLLKLWQMRKRVNPFLFGMGTDFMKLKAPFIWYDVLHVLYVLSSFPQARGATELHEMMEMIEHKQDGHGRYYTESAYRAWKDFDFGQKKEPSRWITMMVYVIKNRLGN